MQRRENQSAGNAAKRTRQPDSKVRSPRHGEMNARPEATRLSRGNNHILGTNMMCARGVPGLITQGTFSAGFSEIPSETPVAFGT